MKLRIVTLSLLLAVAVPSITRAAEEKAKSKPEKSEKKEAESTTSVDPKIEQEVLAAEDQLRVAIEKCDQTLLKQLLADYFSDSVYGEEKATSRAGTIARCRNGKLFFRAIEGKKELTRSAEVITIQGLTANREEKAEKEEKGEAEKSKTLRVQRRWTKKDGQWILIMQERRAVGEDEDRTEKKRPK